MVKFILLLHYIIVFLGCKAVDEEQLYSQHWKQPMMEQLSQETEHGKNL